MTARSDSEIPLIFRQSPPLTARPPFSWLWIAINIFLLLFFRLPLWSVQYTFSSFRPNPAWTWKQALMVRLFRFHHTFTVTLRPEQTAPPKPGGLGGPAKLYETIPATPENLLKGALSLRKTSVRSASRPANWYPSLYDPEADKHKKIILCFNGGAYVLGSHNPGLYTQTLDKMLPVLGNAKYFGVGYRHASTKGQHFPAQLQDAVGAYHHLLTKGVEPSRIIVMGDSAGGNLVLALLRYITETAPLLPPPSAAILLSPWVDLTLRVDLLTTLPTYKREIVTDAILTWGTSAFVPGTVLAKDPYISPGLHPFRCPVPMYIEAEMDEILFGSIVKFSESMQRLRGNVVKMVTHQGGTHANFVHATWMGFGEKTDQSIKEIVKFLDQQKLLTSIVTNGV